MTKFSELPDSMRSDELKPYFFEFIANNNNIHINNMEDALYELLELSERQWHSYEILDGKIKSQIEEFLIKNLRIFREGEIDIVLSIVPRLGLKKTFQYIKAQKIFISNNDILKNIIEAEKEYGEHVDNPYWDLENL